MSVNKQIRKSCEEQIKELENKAKCKHKWSEHGHGYICSNCNHYTGMNYEMNKKIRNKLNK